jgi:hypothetical protein
MTPAVKPTTVLPPKAMNQQSTSMNAPGVAADECSRAKIVTPIEQSIRRANEIGAALRDDHYEPSTLRLRNLGIATELHPDIVSGDLISMGSVIFAEDGGSLRTFSGGLSHECGWWPGFKTHRLQHWEGIAALDFLVEAESNPRVEWAQSEGIAFRFFLSPRWHYYTADMDVRMDGVRHVVEIKRTDADLKDPEYRLKLAAVAEICRRCGWIFRVVLADEIYMNRHHRSNAERFAMRRFAKVGDHHLRRLEAHAMNCGTGMTYSQLVCALEPGHFGFGESIVQALTVRGRIEIDLTSRIVDDTPVRVN